MQNLKEHVDAVGLEEVVWAYVGELFALAFTLVVGGAVIYYFKAWLHPQVEGAVRTSFHWLGWVSP